MISVYVEKLEDSWFGLAYTGEEIVATSTNSTREAAVNALLRSLRSDVEHQIADEGSEFTRKTLQMLKQLESGNEANKRFSLASEYFPDSSGKVLRAAAAIPIGYVTSYGNIAKIADTDPRRVGQIMATNPLYPIVPCHRVVGADFSLVGYGGGKSPRALQAKLERLSKETKGFSAEREVQVNGRYLRVYPVENVINKAGKHDPQSTKQQKLFKN